MQPGLDDLPEPADLHAWLNGPRPLDRGERIPGKAEIAAEYGTSATVQSLTLLARAAEVERRLTDDLLASLGEDASAHQLESRLKSPQSLARKIRKLAGTEFDQQPIEDVVRYTIVVPEPDDLVAASIDTHGALDKRGWTINGAVQSYADGSRYKGLHMFLQKYGERVEVQIHSNESIAVKTRTTPLYVVERDPDQPRAKRAEARNAAIALSAGMRQPAGIERLTSLGGVPVEVRVHGRRGRPADGRGRGSGSSSVEKPGPNGLITESFRTIHNERLAVALYQNEASFLATVEGFEFVAERSRDNEALWIRVIEAGQASGAFHASLDPALTYRFIRDGVWSTVSWYRPGGRHTPETLADQYLKLLHAGILA
jgi:hypothetical protein